MTKKGIVLSVILAILLITIAVMSTRNYKQNKENEEPSSPVVEETSSIELTYDTGFDLENLKSYKVPILIQVISSENVENSKMQADTQELNKQIKGKAIIRIINIKEYPELLKEAGIDVSYTPIQILISSDGSMIKDLGSEIFGYKTIKNDERRRYI